MPGLYVVVCEQVNCADCWRTSPWHALLRRGRGRSDWGGGICLLSARIGFPANRLGRDVAFREMPYRFLANCAVAATREYGVRRNQRHDHRAGAAALQHVPAISARGDSLMNQFERHLRDGLRRHDPPRCQASQSAVVEKCRFGTQICFSRLESALVGRAWFG